MVDQARIEQIVRKAVSEVLAGHLQRLESELVERVLQEVEPRLSGEAGASSSASSAPDLLEAISAIQSGSTQREILRTLLDGAARYSGRVALFVVKGSAATGWQGRGFANSDEIKDFALEIGHGLAARAMQAKAPARGKADEVDGKFTAQFHPPVDGGSVLVLPLLLKEKVAALVYADQGVDAGGKMDTSALELLVLASSAWLEVASLRKHAAKTPSESGNHEEESHSPAHTPAASFSDPFAAHAPAHSQAAAAVMEAPAAQQTVPAATMSSAEVIPVGEAKNGSAAAAALAPDPHAGLSAEDAEIHRKAQRFARLLVDEIKLYNQAKVAEGRKNHDLYDRLKEDIDKSLATYEKRYGQTVAASAGYFSHEVVRSLAEDDISLMGAHFQR